MYLRQCWLGVMCVCVCLYDVAVSYYARLSTYLYAYVCSIICAYICIYEVHVYYSSELHTTFNNID